MVRFFSNVFIPEKHTYVYNSSRDNIRERVARILSKSGGLFTEPDIQGRFCDVYCFQMIAQPALFTLGDKLFYTILHGTILETAPGQTVVKTQITTGILFKFLFVFILAIGTACFYHSIRQLSPVIFIVGAVMFFVCPFIVNWMAGFSKAVVQDRYERYIHKAVKSLTSA